MDMKDVLEAMRLNGLHDEAEAVGLMMEQRSQMLSALKIADKFCGNLDSTICPDSVHIQIRDAIEKAEAAQ